MITIGTSHHHVPTVIIFYSLEFSDIFFVIIIAHHIIMRQR